MNPNRKCRRLATPVLIYDGGLVNRIPVSTCRALGADFIIAVSVTEGLLGRAEEAVAAGRKATEKALDAIGEMLAR